MRNNINRKLGMILLALVLVCAAALLFRWPFNASNLENVPDSVEYVAGALGLVNHGTYAIAINGQSFPPRYPPWFSLFVLAPAYRVLGPEPGNGIVPILFFGLAGVAAAFFLGKRLSGYAGGWLAALFLLMLPLYRHYAATVLTDVPSSALVLVLALLFVRMKSRTGTLSAVSVIGAALLLALSALIRSPAAALVIPFLWLAARGSGRRRGFAVTAFLASPLIAIAANMAFNSRTFDDPFRNGYHFWCPVPYDYLSLTFSPAYLKANAMELMRLGVVLIVAVLALLHLLIWKSRQPAGEADESFRSPYRSLWQFGVLGLGPLLVFHLFYFYPDARLFLPIAALLAVMAGGLAGVVLRRVPLPALVAIQMCITAAVMVLQYRQQVPAPERRLAAETIRRYTPPDAVVLAAIDPVYLGMVLGDSSHRFMVPLSRSVEYASKLVCRKRVENPDPFPVNWSDHRCVGLAFGGAVDAVEVTAKENREWVRTAVRQGRPVYLDTVGTTPGDLALLNDLRREFVLTHTAWSLYRLTSPGL